MNKTEGALGRLVEQTFKGLASLKLAVVVILLLAAALAVGTGLESLYDTATAQYYVYRSVSFHLILGLLGLNIFAVMVDRWPWKSAHGPFLMAHIGILMLLAGSWVTERFGLDATMRVSEGESVRVVESDTASLILSEKDRVRRIAVPWLPPDVPFKPIHVQKQGVPYDLTVDKWITHADPIYSFIPNELSTLNAKASEYVKRPALHLKVESGLMKVTQDSWLWTGDSSFKNISMGPAGVSINSDSKPTQGRPHLAFLTLKNGKIKYDAYSSEGALRQGGVESTRAKGTVIDPGWRGGVKVTVLD